MWRRSPRYSGGCGFHAVGTCKMGSDNMAVMDGVAWDFDEREPAVKALLSLAIRACRSKGKYIGICGQGPSDNPDFAQWLMAQGIESMSLNPDSVIDTWQKLAEI